jgi:NAD(P)-dependent dehydrogenase (short-subunit alcohol dehydrogenase family)
MTNVVMTGGTGGIGGHAAQIIATEPGARLIVGARGRGRTVPAGSEVLPLDLMSLDSVRAFASAVKHRLGEGKINTLVLNAGLQSPGPRQRTAEGFEVTFGVNHLAHYLLARLLLPVIADGGRLVITTSDTHDRAVIPMMAPRTLDPRALAHPAGKASGPRAYAASKLCNLLTARSIAALGTVRDRKITVIAYNPGLTPGTGLVGGGVSPSARAAARTIVIPLLRVISRFKPAFHPGPVDRAGQVLAEVTLGTLTPPAGRLYLSLVKGQVTYPDPGKLARDDTARDFLWRESATMVGLPRDQ